MNIRIINLLLVCLFLFACSTNSTQKSLPTEQINIPSSTPVKLAIAPMPVLEVVSSKRTMTPSAIPSRVDKPVRILESSLPKLSAKRKPSGVDKAEVDITLPKARIVKRPRPKNKATKQNISKESIKKKAVIDEKMPHMPHMPKKPKSKVIKNDPQPATLSGTIQLKSKKINLTAKNIIVTLEAINHKPAPIRQQTYVIDMKNKRYLPEIMIIKAGDQIVFNNKDAIKHNVFSSSLENTFDLGTYGPEKNPSITLKNPGLVKVYCNIHPAMATFLMVTETHYASITKKGGDYQFSNLKPGQYRIKFWHIRATQEKILTLLAAQKKILNITLDASQFKINPHLNKFGKKYPPKRVGFDDDDEFY